LGLEGIGHESGDDSWLLVSLVVLIFRKIPRKVSFLSMVTIGDQCSHLFFFYLAISGHFLKPKVILAVRLLTKLLNRQSWGISFILLLIDIVLVKLEDNVLD